MHILPFSGCILIPLTLSKFGHDSEWEELFWAFHSFSPAHVYMVIWRTVYNATAARIHDGQNASFDPLLLLYVAARRPFLLSHCFYEGALS